MSEKQIIYRIINKSILYSRSMTTIIFSNDNGHPNLIRFRFHLIESHNFKNTVSILIDTNGDKGIRKQKSKGSQKVSQVLSAQF